MMLERNPNNFFPVDQNQKAKTPFWTMLEVNLLTKLYLNGQPIKLIARQLHRTPTAVNKALTRFEIRPQRPQQNKFKFYKDLKSTFKKPESFSDFAQKISMKNDNFAARKEKINKTNCDSKKNEPVSPCNLDKWISFHSLLELFQDYFPCLNLTYLDQEFFVNGKNVSKLQILQMVNRARVQENDRPVFVHGVTW